MPVAWRVVKKKYQDGAFSGEGARQYGGRWNTPGKSVVYVAETLSGALLEIMVHSNRQLLAHYVFYRLEFPKRLISTVEVAGLPKNWRTAPAPPALAKIGDKWLASQQTAVLSVPNAVVPMEVNYLINPLHKDFPSIDIEGPIDYVVDERLK